MTKILVCLVCAYLIAFVHGCPAKIVVRHGNSAPDTISVVMPER